MPAFNRVLLSALLYFIASGIVHSRSNFQKEGVQPPDTLQQLAQLEGQLAPGTDLGAAVAQSAGGTILSLGAGSYPGFIRVTGKSLTISGAPGGGTVLTGGKQGMIVYVEGGGRLVLSNITFRPRSKDGLAVLVKGSQATVTDCRVDAAVQPAFYADGGRIEISRCSMSNLRHSGIYGTNGATVSVSNSVIAGSAADGIILKKVSSGTVTGVRFEKIVRQSIVVSGNSSITVNESRFIDSPGSGVTIDDDSTGTISGSRFEKLAGPAVLGLKGARVTVEGSEFSGIANQAIHIQEGNNLTVAGSRFVNVGGAVVALKGNTALTVRDNTMAGVPVKRFAIQSEISGKIEISGNRIVRAGNGIQLLGKLAAGAQIASNMLVNISGRGLMVMARTPDRAIQIDANLIVTTAGEAVFLNQSPGVALRNNVILSKKNVGIFLQKGSSVQMKGNVVAGANASLAIRKSAPSGSRYTDDIFIGGAPPEIKAITNQTGMKIRIVAAGKKTRSDLRSRADALLAVAGEVVAADALSGVEMKAAALTAAAQSVRERAKSLAIISVTASDIAGRQFSPVFSVDDSGGKPIPRENFVYGSAIVFPGRYIVEPHLKESQTNEVSVRAGETKIIKVKTNRAIVLNVWSPSIGSYLDMVFTLKDRAGLRRALAAYREDYELAEIAVPRVTATTGQRERALTLARAGLESLISRERKARLNYEALRNKPKKQRTDADNKALSSAYAALISLIRQFRLPARIISAIGNADDARRLVEAGKMINVAAYIENRLGILDRGAVAAALRGANASLALRAAYNMHYFGFGGGDALLVNYLNKPDGWEFAGRVAGVLLDTPRGDVLGAMRAMVDRAIEDASPGATNRPATEVNIPAALFLLTYGGVEDMKRVAALNLSLGDFRLLFLASADPEQMIDHLSVNINYRTNNRRTANIDFRNWVSDFAAFCPALRDFSPRKRTLLNKALQRAVSNLGVSYNVILGSSAAKLYYDGDVSFCRANTNAASFVYNRSDHIIIGKHSWIAKPWAEKRLLQSKSYWLKRRLDYVPHTQVVEGVMKYQTGNTARRDLYLAYHGVASNAELTGKDWMPGGAERRAFILANRGDLPGALAAVVSMRPEVTDGKLRIALKFDLAAYTAGSLANMMDPPTRSFQRYLSSRGKALINKVELRRGDKVIPITAGKDDGTGNIVYEAMLQQPGLADLNLHVELKMFKTVWPLTFGLYASDYARWLNRAQVSIAAKASAARARPDDPRALAALVNALQAAGRLTEAAEQLTKALALKPGDINLWFALSDLYTKRGLFAPAVKALRRAVVAVPGNGDLQFELANSLYRAGSYAQAGEEFGKLAALEPENERWKWWEAMNRFLAGDRRGALDYFSRANSSYQRRRTVLLRYIAAKLEGMPDDVEKARAAMQEQTKGRKAPMESGLHQTLTEGINAAEKLFELARTPDQQCQAQLYTGYTRLLGGQIKESRNRFKAALGICRANKLEYRLAEAEFGHLEKVP